MTGKDFIELQHAYDRLRSVGQLLRDDLAHDECTDYQVTEYPPDNSVATPCGICTRCLAVQSWDSLTQKVKP